MAEDTRPVLPNVPQATNGSDQRRSRRAKHRHKTSASSGTAGLPNNCRPPELVGSDARPLLPTSGSWVESNFREVAEDRYIKFRQARAGRQSAEKHRSKFLQATKECVLFIEGLPKNLNAGFPLSLDTLVGHLKKSLKPETVSVAYEPHIDNGN